MKSRKWLFIACSLLIPLLLEGGDWDARYAASWFSRDGSHSSHNRVPKSFHYLEIGGTLWLVDQGDPGFVQPLFHAWDLVSDDKRIYSIIENRFEITDIEGLDRLVTVGSLEFELPTRRVHVDPPLAFVGAADTGRHGKRVFHIIDIANPKEPRLLSTLEMTDFPLSIDNVGSYVLVGTDNQMIIIAVGRPSNPRIVGNHVTHAVRDMFVKGNRVYAASRLRGCQVFDINNSGQTRNVIAFGERSATGVHVEGNRAFVHTQQNGIEIFDIQNILEPRLDAIIDSRYFDGDVVWSAGHTYTSDRNALGRRRPNVEVIDTSDPKSPKLAGDYRVDSNTTDVAIEGDYAYLTGKFGGLQILDVSTPATLQRVGGFYSSGQSLALLAHDGLAYSLIDQFGIHIYDVSDPFRPRELNRYRMPTASSSRSAFPRDFDRSGSRLFVADASLGLIAIEMESPRMPRYLSRFLSGKRPSSVALAGDRAFIGGMANSQEGALFVLDVSNPKSMKQVGQLVTNGETRFRQPNDVAAVGEHVYVALGNELWVVAAKPGEPLEVVASVPTPQWTNRLEVDPKGRLMASNSRGAEIVIYDVSDPRQPTPLSAVDTPAIGPHGFVSSGDHVFITHDTLGLFVAEIPGRANPDRLGEYSLNTPEPLVASNGARTYAVDGQEFLVFSVDRLGKPHLRGQVTLPGVVEWMDAKEDFVVAAVTVPDPPAPDPGVGGGGGGFGGEFGGGGFSAPRGFSTNLIVIDVSNPEAPYTRGRRFVSRLITTGAITDTHAYVASDGTGVRVFNYSNPDAIIGQPTVGQRDGFNNRISLAGARLAHLSSRNRLQVFDLKAPDSPELLFEVPVFEDMEWFPEFAYAPPLVLFSSNSHGLVTVDISDPDQPELLSTMPGLALEEPFTIVKRGNLAFLRHTGGGITVVDISRPEQPRRLGGNSSTAAADLALGSHYAATVSIDNRVLAITDLSRLVPGVSGIRAHDKGITVRVTGPAGTRTVIQRSDDLETWLAWKPFTIKDPEQVIEFEDAPPSAGQQRFYRIPSP